MSYKFSPLDSSVPEYPVEELAKITDTARAWLGIKKRTNEQINYVQKSIFELIEIYFEEEEEKEIDRLRSEALEVYRTTEFTYQFPPAYLEDLYPFQFQEYQYGEELVYTGDVRTLDIASPDNTDEVDALDEIIGWMVDNESPEGFVKAENYEYFYALALSCVSDCCVFIDALNQSADKFGKVSLTMSSIHPITRACMKAQKAIFYAERIRYTEGQEKKIDDLESKYNEANDSLIIRNKTDEANNLRMKKLKIEAANVKHKNNREAKSLVCDDWSLNKELFKSSMIAAQHYKLWLENKGFYYEVMTVRRWILLHAKQIGFPWKA